MRVWKGLFFGTGLGLIYGEHNLAYPIRYIHPTQR